MKQIEYIFQDTYIRQEKVIPKEVIGLMLNLIADVIKSPKKGLGRPHKLVDLSKGVPFEIWSRDIPISKSSFKRMLSGSKKYRRGPLRLVYEIHNELGPELTKIVFTNCGDHMYNHFCYYKSSRSKTKDYYKRFSDEENINI